jgi:hypothetical protein
MSESYKLNEEIINDLLKVIRYKEDENDIFVMKMYCTEENRFKFRTLSKTQA